MKETLLSTCEAQLIKKAISEGQRLDGRNLDKFRDLKIHFGTEFGSVYVCLGETRVLGQVTCSVSQPKSIRPNEGLLFINVELGPMASTNYEAGRSSEDSIQLNRILERAFKDSRCVDLESLCILSEEKVWSLRVDINVLNHEGNLVDCASVACLAALMHFKRPDVTINGTDIVLHTASEKDTLPIVLHHHPVCISLAIFDKGNIAIADPTDIEACVSEAIIVFGINAYKELCGLHLGGITLTNPQLLLNCADKAAKRAKTVVDLVKALIQQDMDLRESATKVNFTEIISADKVRSHSREYLPICLRKNRNLMENQKEDEIIFEDSKVETIGYGSSAALIPKPETKFWVSDESCSDSDESMENNCVIEAVDINSSKIRQTIKDSDEDSEEETKMVVDSNALN